MSYMRRTKLKPLIVLFAFSAVVILSYVFKTQDGPGQSVEGIVTKVKDGDTVVIELLSGEKSFTCRLYGIDSPERANRGNPGQPFGDEAWEELKALVYKQQVTVELTGEKGYRPEICLIKKDNMDINREMVKRGYAWAYRENLKGPYAGEYTDAEKEAREKKLGLWQQVDPQPPWDFRTSSGNL
ncbi:MAG: thermonuclease family protein [Nitrospirae bacterium]|jgi:micrococcal nuclease|nr:thermonuclease family protein [Nitrospirota bacterium]